LSIDLRENLLKLFFFSRIVHYFFDNHTPVPSKTLFLLIFNLIISLSRQKSLRSSYVYHRSASSEHYLTSKLPISQPRSVRNTIWNLEEPLWATHAEWCHYLKFIFGVLRFWEAHWSSRKNVTLTASEEVCKEEIGAFLIKFVEEELNRMERWFQTWIMVRENFVG
jgi:hypothetical protein